MDYIPPRGLRPSQYGKFGTVIDDLTSVLSTPPATWARVSAVDTSTFESIRRDHLLSAPLDHDIALASVALLRRELLKKFKSEGDSQRLKDAAVAKFYQGEAQCKATNDRLEQTNDDSNWSHWERRIVYSVRAKLASILGKFDWNKAADGFGWGPGSTTRIPYRDRNSIYKYSNTPHCTPNASILATTAMRHVPSWFRLACNPYRTTNYLNGGAPKSHPLILVAGNEVLTVPKDNRSDRIIAREPCMNLYLQKGIGELLRKRLLAAGLDLSTQENNRNRCLGPQSYRWATIDLSMASDTVAYTLVQRVSPEDWFAAFDATRSTVGKLDNTTILYEKFSSMGNGYTFELESAIFLAVVRVVLEEFELDASCGLVYGDDIIVPEQCAETVVNYLEVLGFKTNEEKSYWTGPYRESCGMQTWYGEDISPFYVKNPIETPIDLYLFHNNLQRWLWRVGEWLDEDYIVRVKAILKKCRSICPARARFHIPDGYGDSGFIRPCGYLLVSRKRQKRHYYWEVASFPHMVPKTAKRKDLKDPTLARSEAEHSDVDYFLPEGAWVTALERVSKRASLDMPVAFFTKTIGTQATLENRDAVKQPDTWREFETSIPCDPAGHREGLLQVNLQEFYSRCETERWLQDLS